MYQVTVVPPPGFEVSGPASKPADATTGVCMVDFLLRVKPPVTTTTTTAPPPTTTLPPPPAPPTTAGPRLPETGSSTNLQLALAIALTGAGVALVCAARRVRPRHMAR
jgi:LPXTG-motif cell wall-anchored protein